MKRIHLQHKASDGSLLEAVFAPTHGMNLLSFKKDNIEFIDQNTTDEFNRRSAGLGALIGPHFYHRSENKQPPIPDPSIFPHLESLDPSKKSDPLSHGIARYCPWNYTETSSSITGHLTGLDTKNGVTLASLEGFNFKLDFSAHLTNKGLNIKYHVVGDENPATIGLHYYLALADKQGFVTMDTKDEYNDMSVWKKIPETWKNKEGKLHFNLDEPADFGFLPNSDDQTGSALLTTKTHKLKVSYKASSPENAFQLYHPKDASFVCIEPVSAKNPRQPAGNEHKLHIKLEVV